jgi:malonate-semialdehyde dehydrogenase (acetylating)/methylmalonate-semialdehyde dehydrogenase
MSAPREETLAAGDVAGVDEANVRTIHNYIGGRWSRSDAADYGDVRNPVTDALLAKVPLGSAGDVDRAVQAAQKAFPLWRATPPVNRVKILFALKNLLERRFDDIASTCTLEHGKTLDESRSSVRRAIDNVDLAIGTPDRMMGTSLEDIASGIDCHVMRQPLGVFAAITPFNFPAMVPMWFLPHAVACGNTFIVKPSERVPLSQVILLELFHEAGFPEGVVNLVHGAKPAVDAILDHPGIAGVSFVGSSPVAHYVYKRGAERGKRVQALGGAKNFVVVMPDADMDRAAQVSTESCYGCAGERCLANSVVLAVGDAY